jgi:predicted nucleotidyltransferase
MLGAEERGVLRDMAAALAATHLPFVLVGAGARILLLDEPLRLPGQRSTEDWDIGILADSWENFQLLRALLVNCGFTPEKMEHRFLHPSGVPLDVVPFGGLEHPAGSIRWPGSEFEMCVLGFAEALETADKLDLDGVELPVASIPMQAVLKCFAFQDRNDPDDLRDLHNLLRHGAERDAERLFEELAAPLTAGEVDFESAGPALLGMDAGRVLRRSTRDALAPIVQQLTDPEFPGLGWLFTRLGDAADAWRRREAIAKNFAAFAWGLRRKTPPG